VCAAAILVYALLVDPWLADWSRTRTALAAARQKLLLADTRSPAAAKQAAAAAAVPVSEMPQAEEIQGPLFRARLNEQLKKTGIRVKSLALLPGARPAAATGYKLLRLQCTAKCSFEQLMDLLASMDENPYLVGVEELTLKCDAKNRRELEATLIVSTFCK
jgi:hypothetical protein